jgi:hypothetical protein
MSSDPTQGQNLSLFQYVRFFSNKKPNTKAVDMMEPNHFIISGSGRLLRAAVVRPAQRIRLMTT